MEKIKYNKTTGLIILAKKKEFQIGLFDFDNVQLLAYCHIKKNTKAYEILNMDAKTGFTDFIYQSALMTIYPIGITNQTEHIGININVNYMKADNDYLELIKRGVDLLSDYEVTPEDCFYRGYNFLLSKLRYTN